MTNLLETIITSIKNNNIISIVYDNGSGDYFRKVSPYYIFLYNKSIYLLARTDMHKDVATYKLEKIKDIHITALTFSESKKSLPEYMRNNNHFKGSVECIDITPKINTQSVISTINKKIDLSLAQYPKLFQVFDYYERSLKHENLLDIVIKSSEDINHSILSPNTIFDLFSSIEKEIQIDSDFVHVFAQWNKLIKRQPDLSMYLGYPYAEINGKYIPILYYSITYDEAKNQIKLANEQFEINGRFLYDDLELTNEEKKELERDLKNKANISSNESAFNKLNDYFKDLLENNLIINKGIIFLDENTSYIKGLMEEIKEIKKAQEVQIHLPLKSIVEVKNINIEGSQYKNIYNIVDMNERQEEIIKNSNNNLLLVQGPPGTGKTQTIVNIIANEIIRGKKVLFASVNNKAVDNVVDKLKDDLNYEGILRLGNKGMRDLASQQILKLLSSNPKAFDLNSITNLEFKSERINIEIQKLKENIKQIAVYEEKELELKISLNDQSNLLNSIGINSAEILKTTESIGAKDVINCTDLLFSLNRISVWCDNIDNSRSKWIWRLLEKISFDYDSYFVKKIIKKVSKAGIPSENFVSCNFIEQMSCKIGIYINIVQYQISNLNLIETEKILDELGRDRVYSELAIAKESKKENDLQLLKFKHSESLNLLSQNKKDELKSLVENDSNINWGKKKKEIVDLLELFPAVATSSYSLSKSVPIDFVFDVAIIDEASQCDIASSLPIIRRAKRAIIVGDNKQLPPIISIEESVDNSNLKTCNLYEQRELYSFVNNSAFDLIEKIPGVKKFLLNEHYRCHNEIIEFSNENFYEGKLISKTKFLSGDTLGIKLLDVKGRVYYKNSGKNRSASNNDEADAVIDILRNNFDLFKNKTIGIITPFKRQKELIKRKIETIVENSKNEIVKEFFYNVEVGTVHVFQGDERDIIIFSAVLSIGASDGSNKWINDNANLINVAVTRAKELFLMVGNVDYWKSSEGILHKLVRYIEKIGSKTQHSNTKNILNIYKIVLGKNYERFLNNSFIKSLLNKGEERIYSVLKNIIEKKFKNYELGLKIRVSDVINIDDKLVTSKEYQYSLRAHFDFVIFDKENRTLPVVAIEFDGKYHRMDKQVIINDGMKNKICETFRMPLLRISSEDYLTENLIVNMLEKYCR